MPLALRGPPASGRGCNPALTPVPQSVNRPLLPSVRRHSHETVPHRPGNGPAEAAVTDRGPLAAGEDRPGRQPARAAGGLSAPLRRRTASYPAEAAMEPAT